MNDAHRRKPRLRAAIAAGALLLLAAGCGDGGWANYEGSDDGSMSGLFGGDGFEEGGPGYYGMGMPYEGGGVGWGGFNYDE
jgi:hypothetical protein